MRSLGGRAMPCGCRVLHLDMLWRVRGMVASGRLRNIPKVSLAILLDLT